MRTRIAVLLLLVGAATAGCAPSLLQKYVKSDSSQEIGPYRNASGRQVKGAKGQAASIYAVSGNTFRFRLPYDEVWDSALNVLMNDYNIITLDKESGVITTEWDTFYLNDKVYRNKVSVHLKRPSWNVVDMLMYNNVEVLQSGDQTRGTSIWLPSTHGKRELGRIVQNMALALNQNPPVLPAEMLAKNPAPSAPKPR